MEHGYGIAQRANSQLDNVKMFINHNIKVGYTTKETTVEELIQYINELENEYIPLLSEVEKRCEQFLIK